MEILILLFLVCGPMFLLVNSIPPRDNQEVAPPGITAPEQIALHAEECGEEGVLNPPDSGEAQEEPSGCDTEEPDNVPEEAN